MKTDLTTDDTDLHGCVEGGGVDEHAAEGKKGMWWVTERGRCGCCARECSLTVYFLDEVGVSRDTLCAECTRVVKEEAARVHRETMAVPAMVDREEERVCGTCGQRFPGKVWTWGAVVIGMNYCAACLEAAGTPGKAAAAPPEERQARREAAWARVCPPEYRDTDEARVRADLGAAVVDDVLGHPLGKQGMALVGPTGRRKTRLMFLLLRRWVDAGAVEPGEIRYINAVKFGDELAAAYGRSAETAERWMRDLERARVLFIDDLGKEKLTERVLVFYYRVTEYRTGQDRPIFFTSNLNGDMLQARWDAAAVRGDFWADHASAIVRRLVERARGVRL